MSEVIEIMARAMCNSLMPSIICSDSCRCIDHSNAVRAALSALSASGYVVVPKEPTKQEAGMSNKEPGQLWAEQIGLSWDILDAAERAQCAARESAIRAAALEEAAKVCDDMKCVIDKTDPDHDIDRLYNGGCYDCAVAIRALKESAALSPSKSDVTNKTEKDNA